MTAQHSNKQLKRGLFWSFTDNILQQLVNFFVGIILARILSPDEFGLLGIITIFITISITFVDGGLSSALINKQKVKDVDYDTVFWSNVVLGSLLYLLLFLASPFISDYFEEPSLTRLIRIASLSLLLIAFSSIQRTIYVKKLNFKVISVVSIISVAISGSTAIYLAYNGYGVLSLVVRIVLGQLITLISFWIMSHWRPKFQFDKISFIEMYKYGINLLVSKLLNVLNTNLYYFVIGKIFSPASLGFYTRANTFKDLASNNISNTIERVSFSSLSKIENVETQKRQFQKFAFVTLWLTSFFMSILFICAEPIVLILIGEKWFQSIIYLKILSLSGIFLPIYNMNINYLAVRKKTREYLKIELVSKLFIVPVIVLGIYHGIEVLLYGIVTQTIIIYLMSVYYLNYLEDVAPKIQLMASLKVLTIVSVCILISFRIEEMIPTVSSFISLMIYVPYTLCVFLVFTYFFFKKEFLTILLKMNYKN